jgi:hypothetical protein
MPEVLSRKDIKMILPEHITNYTELDTEFSKDLKKVKTIDDFGEFQKKYYYWLDLETQILNKEDWEWIKPLMRDIRPGSKVIPDSRYDPAINLAMPEKIFRISIIALEFKVPWGCAYLTLKNRNEIDY